MRRFALTAALAVFASVGACATAPSCAPGDSACLQAEAERDARLQQSFERQERILNSTEGGIE